jgi:hypothetical protein
MSDVMRLLEALAGNPAFSDAAECAHLLERLDPAVRGALVARDEVALRAALGARASMVCSINVPSDDENDFQDQPAAPDEQPDDSDARAA